MREVQREKFCSLFTTYSDICPRQCILRGVVAVTGTPLHRAGDGPETLMPSSPLGAFRAHEFVHEHLGTSGPFTRYQVKPSFCQFIPSRAFPEG